jgi:phospholipid/cholesterol/gamma-HCH transport system substrate-binding protein
MKEQRLKFWIGVFVLLSLMVFIVLVIMFGSVPTFLTSYNRYTVILPQAPRVGPGTPVTRSGVPIGKVDSVQLDNETGKVRINILVEKKYSIPAGDEPVLNAPFMGDPSIEFVPKEQELQLWKPGELMYTANYQPAEAPPKSIPPGSEIQGKVPTDPQQLLNQMSRLMPVTQQAVIELGRAAQGLNQVLPQFDAAVREIGALSRATREGLPEVRRTNDEAQAAIRTWNSLGERLNVLVATNEDKLTKALEDFDNTVVRLGRAVSDDNLRNMNTILKNGATSSERFPSIAANAEELTKEGRQTLLHMEATLRQADAVLANIQKVTQPLGDRGSSMLKSYDEAGERLNKVLADVQGLMQVINQRDGTVQRLIADPSLYNNLNTIACQVEKMMPRLEQTLHDLEIFADKLARHPESIGLGGAVRPSSGIK